MALRRLNKKVAKNGLRLGTDARNGIAHAWLDQSLTARRGAVPGIRSTLHRIGGPRGTERHQDVGFGLPYSRIGEGAASLAWPVADVSLEKARERANELTSAARTGHDLIAEEEERRVAAVSRLTVKKLIELYVRRRVTGRLRTAKEIESRLRRALAPILHRHADDIRRRDIRELLDAVADQGIEREAEKRRQTIGAMFRWALSQDIVESDATAGLKAYDPGTPRDRVLTAEEIEALWKWLDSGALPSDPTDIMKLELLTGARCSEISGLCAEEIDRSEWTWTLPAARSKNKRPRVTPLIGLARQIIEARLSAVRGGPLFTRQGPF